MEAWRQAGRATAKVTQITVAELHRRIEEAHDLQIVDVRRPGEYQDGHVPQARIAPLSELQANTLDWLNPSRSVVVICAGGYRSSAATSLLESRGFQHLYNVIGGTSAYVAAGYPVEKVSD